MSSPPFDRVRLLEALNHQARLLTTNSLLFEQAVADQLKLNVTDLHCANLLTLRGAITAGQLAELTGLTTGAITGVIDRLERAGYVRRESDPQDRRRVVIQAVSEAIERNIGAQYESLARAAAALHANYSDQELALLMDYLTRTNALTLDEAANLRQTSAQANGATTGYEIKGEHVAVPLGALKAGHLVFTAGATVLNISGDTAQPDLFRAHFGTLSPTVIVLGGLVKVFYRRSLLNWNVGTADVTLNGTIPWRLDLSCSSGSYTADLRAVPLKALDVNGNASEINITLPQPTANVPFRIAGNASDVVVRRAAGTALQVRLRGGASSLIVDWQDFSDLGRKAYQTPGYAQATQRYDIEVTARLSSVAIETYS